MKKRVLILSTSPRQGGNSDALAASFAEGARSAGHTVSHCSLRDKSLHFCLGCLSCQETPGCVLQDDMAEILSQMRTADVLVFATPIYFYEMSGQMKTLLDRTNPLFSGEYASGQFIFWPRLQRQLPRLWMVRSTVWRAGLPVFPRPPCKGLSAAAASPGLERYRILPPCPRPAPWGPLYEMGVLPGGPVPLSVRLQRAGCTCGTARNISNHGGLSYAYPMPRRPRRRVSCHPAGQPKYTRLGPPAAHDPYTGGTQWKREIRPPAGGTPH